MKAIREAGAIQGAKLKQVTNKTMKSNHAPKQEAKHSSTAKKFEDSIELIEKAVDALEEEKVVQIDYKIKRNR